MVKRSRVRFCVSCNYSWTVHFFVKILLKLKILSTSACLNLNYGTAKQYLVGRGFLTAYLMKTPPPFTAYLLFSFFFVCFMQQVVKLTVIWHRLHGFCYESDLISRTAHTDINIQTLIYINTTCYYAHSSYLYYTE